MTKTMDRSLQKNLTTSKFHTNPRKWSIVTVCQCKKSEFQKTIFFGSAYLQLAGMKHRKGAGWKHTVATAGFLERPMGRFHSFPFVCLGDPVHVRLFASHLLHKCLLTQTIEKELSFLGLRWNQAPPY